MPEPRTFPLRGTRAKFKFQNASMSSSSSCVDNFFGCFAAHHHIPAAMDQFQFMIFLSLSVFFVVLQLSGEPTTAGEKICRIRGLSAHCTGTHFTFRMRIMFDHFIWFWLFVFATAEFRFISSFFSSTNMNIWMLRRFHFFRILTRSGSTHRVYNDAVDLFYWNGMRAASSTPSKTRTDFTIFVSFFFKIYFVFCRCRNFSFANFSLCRLCSAICFWIFTFFLWLGASAYVVLVFAKTEKWSEDQTFEINLAGCAPWTRN